ncbi:quinone oxidoreductase family protein [Parvicella tangerina]|uniref:Phthiocerol synthesis polyketide synthase type I PpsC n=1 Tax=Parvicella tangerina TaxID=2829795 RepID=A0A916JK81_9FLAO|nr:zinc-binding dehydrogenase [Parvicella tangerina]CAG5077265.1 Phthiocerol synthesis polyketide synthase type I PpsC [Parvicella tangerina]
MSKMKAAVLVKTGSAEKAFEIREVQQPTIEGLEVLIKVEAFGLNFADVMARNGLYQDAPPLPSILGYDVVGEVVEVATDEAKHLIGKRVVAMTRFGGYAEYAKTDYRACAVISDNISATKAAALATQYCTAYYAAYECINVFEGDYVLIHAAAGGVGTALTQLCKHKGCTVFGTTGSDAKFDYLKANGVDYPINYRKHDYEREVKKQGGGRLLDVAFNSVGGTTFKKDFKLLEKGGKSVIYGAAERSGKKGGAIATLGLAWNFGLLSPIQLLVNSKGVIGINMLRIADFKPLTIKRCLEEVVRMTEEGILNPSEGGTYSFEKIGEAHAYLESRKSTGKIAVTWN